MMKETRIKWKLREKQEEEKEEFLKYIENESKDISYFLFNYYFNFKQPSDLVKKLFEIKDKKKNDDQEQME